MWSVLASRHEGRIPGSLGPHAPFFHDNLCQALERTVGEFEAKRGMATRLMGPEARRQLVSKLDATGLLSIRNAPSVVAQRMGISRASLYVLPTPDNPT